MAVSHGEESDLGLDYSDGDVESSRMFVLFCPCKILEDGTMIKYTELEDPCTLLFLHRFSNLNPTSRPSRSRRIHRIHNYRSIRRLHRGLSLMRRLQRHQRTNDLGASWRLRQAPNRNIHLIPHPQTSCSRGKTTHPLRPRLWSKSQHHGGGHRNRLRSSR